MDPKAVKKGLKLAREFIDSKDFDNALKECEKILDNNVKDYTTYLFAGLASSESGKQTEAENFYRKATELDPEKPQAWQGLLTNYEKNNVTIDDKVLECITTLLNLTNDPKKKTSLSLKRCRALSYIGRCDEAVAELKLLNGNLENCDQSILTETLIQCAQADHNLKPESAELVMKMIEDSFKLVASEQLASAWLSLSKNNVTSRDLAEICVQIAHYLPEHVECKNTLMGIVVSEFVLDKHWALDDKRIACLIPQEILSVLVGVSSKEWETAAAALDSCATEVQTLPWYHYLSVPVFLNNKNWASSIKTCLNISAWIAKEQASCKSHTFWVPLNSQLQLWHAGAFFGLNTVESRAKCTQILQKLVTYDFTTQSFKDRGKILLCKAYETDGSIEEAWKALSQVSVHDSADYYCSVARIQLGEKKINEAKENALKVLKKNPENAEGHLLLGKILWEMNRRDPATLREFLLAAKGDSRSWETFLYMGHYYKETGGNAEKRGKCYERAWRLDNSCLAAALAYSDELSRTLKTKTQIEESHVALLEEVTAKFDPKTAPWAFFRLGLQLTESGKVKEAIGVLQKLSRICPDDHRGWECLGDAYYSRGSYESSLRSYKKVLELTDDTKFALLRIACVQLKSGLLTECSETCNRLVKEYPEYGPAHLVKMESSLKLAEKRLKEGRVFGALDDARLALKHANKATKLGKLETSALWKLMGDTYIMLSHYPASILSKGHSEQPQTEFGSDFNFCATPMEALEFATRCYLRGLSLRKDSAGLWHDAGLSFLRQRLVCSENDRKAETRKRAIDCLRRSLALKPNDGNSWVSLGVCYSVESPELAQHCFVKALELEQRNARAWTCLGTLYLINGDDRLAHEALKMAQSSDPDYAHSWCAQAVIAQSMDHHQAMDLFRHSLQLQDLPVAASFFAIHVLKNITTREVKTDYSMEDQLMISLAVDSMIRQCLINPEKSIESNLCGLLMEEQGFFGLANGNYKRASRLIQSEECAINSIRAMSKLQQRDDNLIVTCGSKITRMELAKVNAKLGNFSKAAELYGEAARSGSNTVADQALCLSLSGDLAGALDLISTGQETVYAVAVSSLLELMRSKESLTDRLKQNILRLMELGADSRAMSAVFKMIKLFQRSMPATFVKGWLVHQFPHRDELRGDGLAESTVFSKSLQKYCLLMKISCKRNFAVLCHEYPDVLLEKQHMQLRQLWIK